jgi:hypothetical protein
MLGAGRGTNNSTPYKVSCYEFSHKGICETAKVVQEMQSHGGGEERGGEERRRRRGGEGEEEEKEEESINSFPLETSWFGSKVVL